MAKQPASPAHPPQSSIDQLELVKRFSSSLLTVTELGLLAERVIQELCRTGGAPHGALYLFDRDQESFRRAALVGSRAGDLFPLTVPLTHPVAQDFAATHELILHSASSSRGGSPRTPAGPASLPTEWDTATILPHRSRGRLIAFSLLGPSPLPEPEHQAVQPLLSALAQIATNAIDTLMLYEDLHRSHLLMKRTDRLRSLETIAGGFAHEIRNPMTSIKTFIQLAPERKDDPDFIKEFSRIVLDDVYRIERLIEEILDYARYMEPKLTEEDINDIVSSCLYFIDVKADSRGTKIEKDLASDLPRVMLDRQQIKQVFLNLFLNAIDAMGEAGGSLRVRTRPLARAGGKPWVQIEVEDTGQGIPEANLEHIFDPFFTTKHESGEHEGTGLGLTIVHQIIQEHHGEIQVKSTVGVGTTFLINLPALPS